MKNFLKTGATLAVAALMLASCGKFNVTGASRAAEALAAKDAEAAARPMGLMILPDQGPTGLVDAVKGAKKSIELEIYMITTSGAAGDIVNALIERKQAGVDVRVILETQPFIPATPPNCGNPPALDINKAARVALTTAGVKVQYSSPRFKYTHEKAMLIDHQTAYVMTTNFTGAAFKNNREYVVIDQNPADVASLAGVFQADWDAQIYKPTNPNLVLSPTNSRSQLRDLINSAKSTIQIEVEFATDPELIGLLGAKAKAGVDVSVLLSGQSMDKCTGSDIDNDEIAMFNKAGVTKVAVMKKLTLHAKTIIVDSARGYVGSENLSANSLDNNRELGLIISDKNVLSKIAATIKGDWYVTANSNAPPPAPSTDAPAELPYNP